MKRTRGRRSARCHGSPSLSWEGLCARTLPGAGGRRFALASGRTVLGCPATAGARAASPGGVDLQGLARGQARAAEVVPAANLVRRYVKPVGDQLDRVPGPHSIMVEAAWRAFADSRQ